MAFTVMAVTGPSQGADPFLIHDVNQAGMQGLLLHVGKQFGHESPADHSARIPGVS